METKRLVIVAVGGQGNLLASSVLGEAALLCDIPLNMSEIHGMAQRGGRRRIITGIWRCPQHHYLGWRSRSAGGIRAGRNPEGPG